MLTIILEDQRQIWCRGPTWRAEKGKLLIPVVRLLGLADVEARGLEDREEGDLGLVVEEE